jgi:hypothetical protein
MVAAFLKVVNDWLPVIQLVGVILLLKYVMDTAAIKMATLQPFLVLDHELRDASDQLIFRHSHRPTPATELPDNLLIRNIGAGPAYDVVFTFEGVERIGSWKSSTPYLKPGQAIEAPIAKISIKRGEAKFEATYSSLAFVRFQSRQVLNDGVLGRITIKKLRIFGRPFAFLRRIKLALVAKLEERRNRKRVAALYH